MTTGEPTPPRSAPTANAPRVLGPESVTWKYAGQNLGSMLSGTVLLLQVAHPVVGAGVAEFSTYKTDPWGRLDRTVRYVTDFIYGGPVVAPESGKDLREMHRSIKGTDCKGRRYAALDPEAYAWVHLTLFDAIVRAQALYAEPLAPSVLVQFYEEWKIVGDLLGVRRQDAPSSFADFEAYVERMIATRLESNDVVTHLLGPGVLKVQKPPFSRLVPDSAWNAFYAPIGQTMRLATIGAMRPSLRDKLGLPYTAADAKRFERVRRVVRASAKHLPEPLRYGPLALDAMRAARAGRPQRAYHVKSSRHPA